MFCSLDVPARAPGRTRSGGPGRRAPVLLLGLVVWLTVGAALAADRRVELLVFGPGDDVFGRYGHAALRVVGPGSADRVFNFGITDWTKPNYIRDFLTGRVRFWGNVKPWERARKSYVKWDRTIVRYPLELTPDEVDGLVARMEHDVLPEHREYVYDTFRDNCATRLRDYLDTATGGAVRRSLADDPLGPSYREGRSGRVRGVSRPAAPDGDHPRPAPRRTAFDLGAHVPPGGARGRHRPGAGHPEWRRPTADRGGPSSIGGATAPSR
jgi:hypothetical protein